MVGLQNLKTSMKLSLAAQYLNNQFTHSFASISIKGLRGSKTAELLAENLGGELENLKSLRKDLTLTVTRNNAANVAKACKLLLDSKDISAVAHMLLGPCCKSFSEEHCAPFLSQLTNRCRRRCKFHKSQQIRRSIGSNWWW